MSIGAATLSHTVSAMRPMAPAKDFETSKRFYIELGFQPHPLTEQLIEMQLGVFSFILQAHYVREWADNFLGLRRSAGQESPPTRSAWSLDLS